MICSKQQATSFCSLRHVFCSNRLIWFQVVPPQSITNTVIPQNNFWSDFSIVENLSAAVKFMYLYFFQLRKYCHRLIWIFCLTFLDEASYFLSLRIIGLLTSSSLFLVLHVEIGSSTWNIWRRPKDTPAEMLWE